MYSVSTNCDTGGISVRVKTEIERKLIELGPFDVVLYQ